MNNHLGWLSKLKISELSNSFLMSCGVLFVLINLKDIYWPSEVESFGGFFGQLLFALLIAISSTYFAPSKTKESGVKK